MLRLTSALSLATWLSILVGTVAALFDPELRRSDLILFVAIVVVSFSAVALSAVMLARNRPFLIGLSVFLSVIGLLPGLLGVGLLIYCITVTFDSSSFGGATSAQWFFGINNAVMIALPFNWASLWRDYRHDIPDRHLTTRWI